MDDLFGRWVEIEFYVKKEVDESLGTRVIRRRRFTLPKPAKGLVVGFRTVWEGRTQEHHIGGNYETPYDIVTEFDYSTAKRIDCALVCLNPRHNPKYVPIEALKPIGEENAQDPRGHGEGSDGSHERGSRSS